MSFESTFGGGWEDDAYGYGGYDPIFRPSLPRDRLFRNEVDYMAKQDSLNGNYSGIYRK